MYIYIYIYMCICMYIYIYIYREISLTFESWKVASPRRQRRLRERTAKRSRGHSEYLYHMQCMI